MGVRAGRLRHLLLIQSVTRSRTSSGSWTETWADVATVWGAVEPLRGREYLENQQVQGTVTHRIILRDRSDVTTANRIRYGSRTFNLIEVLRKDERLVSLEIMAQEQVS